MELTDVESHLTSDNGCPDQVVECGNKCGHKERRATVKKHMTTKCRFRQEKCKYCRLVSTHEQVTGDHFPTHREVCPMQPVECEYKRFGCVIVLPRKDIAEHLKTSVEAHLQMTKRRVEEQEVRLQEQEVRLQEQEVHLQEQGVRRQKHEVHLQEQEARLQERAEREKQRMNDVIACLVDRVEQLELEK